MPLLVGTLLTVASIAAAFVIPALFPTERRNLDGMIDTLGTVLACLAAAAVIAIVTVVWVASAAHQAGRRFPLVGLLPLGLIGGLIALGAAAIAYQNFQKPPREPRPVAAPAEPIPKPAR